MTIISISYITEIKLVPVQTLSIKDNERSTAPHYVTAIIRGRIMKSNV